MTVKQLTGGTSMAESNLAGLSQLQSLQVLQQMTNPGTTVSTIDVVGLIGGGLVGWWIASKFPKAVVKYIGVIVGAELGILVARMVRR